MRVYLARHPVALDAKHPILIEEMLALRKAGKGRAVSTIIAMVRDLMEHGRSSRFLVRMTGFPIYELKPRSRGGEKGGTRVYLFLTEHDEAALVTCEVKDSDAPDPAKLKLTVQVAVAHKQGLPVLQKRR
jgi:hypothetical protein